MKVIWPPEARKDLEEFPVTVQKEVEETVRGLEEEGLSLDAVGLASGQDLKLWRVKVNPGKKGVDHRVLFDLMDQDIVILGVWHRDDAYSTRMWNSVQERL